MRRLAFLEHLHSCRGKDSYGNGGLMNMALAPAKKHAAWTERATLSSRGWHMSFIQLLGEILEVESLKSPCVKRTGVEERWTNSLRQVCSPIRASPARSPSTESNNAHRPPKYGRCKTSSSSAMQSPTRCGKVFFQAAPTRPCAQRSGAGRSF